MCDCQTIGLMIEYSRHTLREMFDGRNVSPVLPYMSLDSDRQTAELVAKGNGRISLSGVQAKYSMVAENGVLRLTGEGEQGRYILKPAPTAPFILDRKYCPANEYLTMQLARQVYGINVAPCCLCEFGNGDVAYLVKRFDIRPDGGKYPQEDFAQLAGLSRFNGGDEYKYEVLSYEECGELIDRYVKASPVELLKFFRLVLFNYITLNNDAHLKNFSIIDKADGDYTLTPAYDLMNTSLHLGMPGVFALKKGLFKEGTVIDDTHHISGASFVEFGRRLGLPSKLVAKEIDRMAMQYPLAEELIQNSYLDDRLKRYYQQSYDYRRYTLTE